MNAISILVVDHLTLLREAWSLVLKDDPRFNVLGQTGCGEEAVRFCRQYKPDVVIMNISC
ncbi:MAG: hypothetical protein H0V30_06705 [Chitinophagaceae bacterium]|jgi:chemotaxis response regulator CheB|nr:hypothetical protein [Chitinophagaceae bacterium]